MSKTPADFNAATLQELLSDPLVRMVMRADQVTERQLVKSVTGVLHELSMGSSRNPADRSSGRSVRDYRPRVGIILLNKHNQVFVGLRRQAAPAEVWQLLQGDINRGEEPRDAAMRILREKISTDRADILAEDKNWLYYELPVGVTGRVRHKGGRGQRQKWFVMRFKGTEANIAVDKEGSEFCDWKWISISELPKHIVSFKKLVYLSAMEEFLDAMGPYEDRDPSD